jgi:colanic acid biosynthesis glycosyl transferase WcaI
MPLGASRVAANAEEADRPLKIIFLNRYFHPDHSATSQLLSDLAFDLAAGGHEVHVIAGRQRYDDPAVALPGRERIGGVEIHRVWSSRFGRARLSGRALDYLSFYVSATTRALSLTQTGDILVAKTDPPLVSIFAAAVAQLRRAVLVNWLQDVFPEVASALGVRGLRGRQTAMLRKARNRSLHIAGINAVLSEGMAHRLKAEGIRPETIRIIHNWADTRQIYPVPSAQNPLRTDWGLEGKFVVGYSGNLGRVHDFSTILEAAQQLSSDSRFTFLFIGDGPQRAWLAEQVRSRRLANVTFQPHQPRDRLAASLSAPDVHVVSLRPELEGLVVPSKLYGIAAAGRPTIFIGDPRGEIADMLREQQCGVAVRQGDGYGLASCITRLADDQDRRHRLGSNARELCEQRFDRRFALAAWQALLAEARSLADAHRAATSAKP